jgi:wyosine [tRNA(Phe)-imidazoG37] synthetase (radical SAM superfamily)
VITLIGIFTFPLLGKIEDRKISVLKFFNMLNIEQIGELIQRGRDFQVEFEQMNRLNNNQSLRLRQEDIEDEEANQLS